MATAKNVLGTDLEECSRSPLSGFYRDGCCNTGGSDEGVHVVCAEMTEAFLRFAQARGNDLITPVPEYDFPGLRPGDQWCLCVGAWKEAYEAGVAPPVILASTHISAIEFVELEQLQAHAVDA